MHIDADGEWIREGLLQGMIRIAHDGSYMHEASCDVCAIAVILFCASSHQWAKISVTERSESTNSFRGKLLGAVMIQYMLLAAPVVLPVITTLVCLYCNNLGVIARRNLLQKLLPDKQPQSKLIHLLEYLVDSNTLRSHWEWVEGHAVASMGWCHCLIPKKLAKRALLSAIADGHTITVDYPLEPIQFSLSGTRVIGSPCLALR
jgi:hypothetical protein